MRVEQEGREGVAWRGLTLTLSVFLDPLSLLVMINVCGNAH